MPKSTLYPLSGKAIQMQTVLQAVTPGPYRTTAIRALWHGMGRRS
jgi:hypothetical protein